MFWSTSSPPPPPVDPAAAQMIEGLRYSSIFLLAGYAVAVSYRIGLVAKLLPAAANKRLEATVEKIKEKTEPIGNATRFAMARRHLIRAYSWATSGMVALAAGSFAFRHFPHLPIALPLITTMIPAAMLVGIPKAIMIPAGRLACFYVSWFSAGYAAGPVSWVAQDSLLVFVMLTGCTLTGLCVPLFLTRGMVSYVVSSQTLSFALACCLVTTPKTSPSMSPFKDLKSQPGVQVILDADVNVLLTLQLLSNMGICALHTLPVIYRYVTSTQSDEALEREADPLKEAYGICAGFMYVVYRATRWATKSIIHRVLSEDVDSASENHLTRKRQSQVDHASGVISGVITGLLYVRAVSRLQKGDPADTLNGLRAACQHFSPLGNLLGTRY